ncbi:hypothetical protein KI659_16485 [Litoribacter alkaliphilus]|uniref:Uncharacterized protein n=1 Tax=Litoribacter ruber TaxID=702568 RepID=A0AAP2CK35_9BACT|nr:hypothetical protein [Litoribacter alkaliphilus]MBS9525617.1 hypothetical protein [Litoribacter alkaliphilus]
MKSMIGVFMLLAAVGCTETPVPEGEERMELNYTFEQDMEGWQGGFSDLPTEGQDIYELDYGHRPLPEETGQQGNALFIQGHNRSDDLFMFFKRQINGLQPNTQYEVSFEIELASQYPEESFGIGGSPGGSVFLKAGAVNYEPLAEPDADGYLQMNLDKGNQAADGADMYDMGTVGIEGEEFAYTLISRQNINRPLRVNTDDQGSLWLIFGTDSGFEGLTELYYNSVKVNVKK